MTKLPHHNLIAYQVALELLDAVVAAGIKDSGLRDQALRAAKSAALNIAEAAGRCSPKDQARVFMIARGEAVEAVAAVEIAVRCGDARQAAFKRAQPLASRLVALLTGLIR